MNANFAGAARRPIAVLAAAALLGLQAAVAHSQAREQFVPANFYWVGPYAAGGSGVAGGMLDYLQMLNTRDGGINGVKFTWEKCETEYNNARGIECYERTKKRGPTGATLIHPLSTGITYSLLDRAPVDKIPIVSIGYGRADAADGRVFPYVFPLITTYWDQAATMIRYIGEQERGLEKLRGRHIALLYHDSAYGKEPIPVLTELAAKYGYRLSTIPVPHPGNEQQSQWLEIRRLRPDWVILWGWGVMNPTALKSAARAGYPRKRMIGVWWSGAEEDVIPAGDAAKDFVAAGLNVSGTSYPVIENIQKYVYAKDGGEMEDTSRIGSVYYNRGVVFGIITAEAVRAAQRRFGKGKPVTGEQVQWALEHLRLDDARLKRLGAVGFMPPLETSCADHEGSGLVRFMRWDGERWNVITDWMAPMPEDRKLVRQKYLDSAASYAKTKGITPRRCPAT
ncbi:MAG: ABC transporter substrate-binding protein [Betaproteobacteria bacterium]|nr:ABC transporter substrate-binding protein [Betaproteobacteria bacterium]